MSGELHRMTVCDCSGCRMTRELDHEAWENNDVDYVPQPMPKSGPAWSSIGIFGVWLAIIWTLVFVFRDFFIGCAQLWFHLGVN